MTTSIQYWGDGVRGRDVRRHQPGIQPGYRAADRGGWPVAYYLFGGWKALLFGDTYMYGPRGSASTSAQGGDVPLARLGDVGDRTRRPPHPLSLS
jgi:hypothetical protein